MRVGDCLDILPTLPRESVHMVITDPPYFLDGLCDAWKKGNDRSTGAIRGLPVGMKFDPRQGLNLQTFMNSVAVKILPVLKPGAFAIFFSQPRLSHRMAIAIEDAGFEIRDMLAWRFTSKSQFKAFSQTHFIENMNILPSQKQKMKDSVGNRRTPQLRPQYESMILAQKPKIGTFVNNWLEYETGLMNATTMLNSEEITPSTVFTVDKEKKDQFNSHLTVKPLALIQSLIRLFSIEKQIVLDPFIGSGTTAVAAQSLNRYCLGIEKNKDYANIAFRRFSEKNENK